MRVLNICQSGRASKAKSDHTVRFPGSAALRTLSGVSVSLMVGCLATSCGSPPGSSTLNHEADSGRNSSSDYSDSSNSDVDQPPAFDVPTQPFPGHGVSQSLSGDCVVTGIGQLTLSVPAGDESYFAKLVNRDSGGFTLGVTVAPGQSATVDVPICNSYSDDYDLKYAAGTTWYGYDHAFGPAGAYASASEVFPFEDGTWWEVELILQVGGNLGTSGMSYGDF